MLCAQTFLAPAPLTAGFRERKTDPHPFHAPAPPLVPLSNPLYFAEGEGGNLSLRVQINSPVKRLSSRLYFWIWSQVQQSPGLQGQQLIAPTPGAQLTGEPQCGASTGLWSSPGLSHTPSSVREKKPEKARLAGEEKGGRAWARRRRGCPPAR